jgi:50S ribosomal protein L16 3-hydroxylase
MPAALERVRPAITRNELGWLATLADVESRLVFVERDGKRCRYRAETGPFEPEYLQGLPKRDWTLLVHDVEKHLPTMQALFAHVPFIPDWRIDDLMVSFAAPGGGVGPHRDNYDVFLCQGIGVRNWCYTNDDVAADPAASDDLALLAEFAGSEDLETVAGDVLYLPPGVAHWGVARRASMTYSIGMRAPEASDLSIALEQSTPHENDFYRDPDLSVDEARPGYISQHSARRATALLGLPDQKQGDVAASLGQFATQTKDWLRPEAASADEIEAMLVKLRNGAHLKLHGMSQIAFDQRNLYVNGSSTELSRDTVTMIEKLCLERRLFCKISGAGNAANLLRWMLQNGAFELPETF